VTITNTGAITGTAGIAIDLAAAGAANTINQQAGAISGDIRLSAAADQLTVTGGTINGNVGGQGPNNVDFDLGAGAFTFAAAFVIGGINDMAVHSGEVVMDGGFNVATLDVDGGRLVANSVSMATGGSTVETGGTLAVNGTLNGTMDVLAGGRLQGIGTVAGLTTNIAGGTVAPGNSIGTLTVASNYVGDGGLLEIEAELGSDAKMLGRTVPANSPAPISMVLLTCTTSSSTGRRPTSPA
jgi:hypothetical protein